MPTIVHFEIPSDDIFAKGFVKDGFMKTKNRHSIESPRLLYSSCLDLLPPNKQEGHTL
jgi:hypothetical protein